MKKSAWTAFIIMAAALAALPIACKEIDSRKEDVAVTEEVIYGNPDAAAGITLWTAIHLEEHLLWDTEYTIGSGEQAKSSFTFSSKAARTRLDQSMLKDEYIICDLYVGGFGSIGGSASDFNRVDLINFPLPEVTKQVAARTGAGQENVEIIRLCDYYEYYPVEMYMDAPIGNQAYIKDSSEVRDYLQDLFRIPVEKETMVEIAVEKDLDGEIISIHSRTAENPMAIEGVYDFGEKGCYYAYYFENWETGEILDRGQNNGIFYLPYAECGQRQGSAYAEIDMTLMEKVCGLPGNVALAQMMLDEEKGRMYLVVKGQEGYSLAVYTLDGTVPVLEQEIPVLQAQDAPLWAQMTLEEEGLFLVWQDNSFSFVTEEDGAYRLWCSGVFPESEIMRQEKEWILDCDIPQPDKDRMLSVQKDVFLSENALAFDGERLALAAYEQRGIDVRLAVYGQEGMRYSGIYRNSMAEGYYGSSMEKQGTEGFWGFSRAGSLLKPLGLK